VSFQYRLHGNIMLTRTLGAGDGDNDTRSEWRYVELSSRIPESQCKADMSHS
jgi:hypothetical protein